MRSVPDAPLGRVVFVAPDSEGRGGIASVVRVLLETFDGGAWDVRLVRTVSSRGATASLVSTLMMPLRVARLVSSAHTPVVCHAHVASRGSFVRKAVALAVARAFGARTVLHLHGARFDSFYSSLPAFARPVVARAFRKADVVVTLSPEWREFVKSTFGVDSEVVPNPVLVPERPAAEGEEPTVVFLGRLGERKGTPELLDAIGLLQARGDRTKFVLAGDGDVEDAKRRVAELLRPGLVDLPGWVGPADVSALLANASVFCLPSHDEGKPVALLEAMAAGVAPVVTPVGGIPDVVTDRENGIIVPVGDAAALAGALEEVLRDDALRARLRMAARESVIETYSARQVAGVWSSLYSRLTGVSEPREELRSA